MCAWLRLPLRASLVLLATCAPLIAQTQHLVHIGGFGGFQLIFTDQDTQTNVTFARPGDTVRWTWDYLGIEHSTTSGTCTGTFFGVCTPDSIWDSGFRFNPPRPPDFTRQFNELGTFPYFCMLHGPTDGMRGKVVVLTGPDYQLTVTDNSFFPPPVPTITVLAGRQGTFTGGQLIGFLGYSNLVNLSCTTGSPRNPDNCPVQSATPGPFPNGTNFNFSVGDSTAGDYTFNLTGIGTDPDHKTHSQTVKLSVVDLALTAPNPNPVKVLKGQNSNITFQFVGINNFSGFVSATCSGLPNGASCSSAFASIFPPFEVQNESITIFTGSAPPGIYPFQIVANSSFGGFPVTRTQDLTLRLVPADHLNVRVSSTNVTAGTPFALTVTAADTAGNPMQNYTGTVHFTSSDPSIAASLPGPYTFTGQGGDNGVHTFNITLNKIEPVTITATDPLFSDLAATSPVIRVRNGAANVTVAVTSSRAPTSPPHFFPPTHVQDAVTFTATVSALSGTTPPDGDVRFFDGVRPLGMVTLAHSSPTQSTAALVMDGVQRALSPGGHDISVLYEPSEGSTFTNDLSLPFSQPRSPAPRCNVTRCPGNER